MRRSGNFPVFVENYGAMQIVEKLISKNQIKDFVTDFYGYMVKAVVDVSRGIMAVNAELHSDLKKILLENGSKQDSLWGSTHIQKMMQKTL